MSATSSVLRHDYTFASDNTAGITPEVTAALALANQENTSAYGEDEWTERAKKMIQTVLATDCEVFFVLNGTAANTLALSQFCRSYHSVICHESAHIQNDECGAVEFFTGGSKLSLVSGPDAKISPESVRAVLARTRGVHSSKPGALSLTQSTEWGTVYTPAEICALSAVAREAGLAVHMDGARFANAAAALSRRGFQPADFTWRAGVDVLSFGGTKNGMLTTEAVVFFKKDHAQEFEYRVKQGGQLASKNRFAAAQWIGMLQDGAWLRHAQRANAMTAQLAAALREFTEVKLIAEPQVNGLFVEMPFRLAEALAARGGIFIDSSASTAIASCARGRRLRKRLIVSSPTLGKFGTEPFKSAKKNASV